MSKITLDRIWSDFSSCMRARKCTFCGEQALDFDHPVQGEVAGVDIIAVSCAECGHMEIFRADTVQSVAKAFDAELRKKGWRQS